MNKFTSKLNNKSNIFYENLFSLDLGANKNSDPSNPGFEQDLIHSNLNSILNLNLFISSDFKKANRSFLNEFIEKELQTIDQINNLNLSISHTDTLGAVVIMAAAKEQKSVSSTKTEVLNVLNAQAIKPENLKRTTVGVDVEQTERLSEKLIRRIAEEEEINLLNPLCHWKLIWPIKEAAFKAVYRYQKYIFCSNKPTHFTERTSTNQNSETKETINDDDCIKTISQIKIISVKNVENKIHFQATIKNLDSVKYQSAENAIPPLESISILQVTGIAFSFQDHSVAVAILR